jgi:hypothetical protein
MKITYLICVLLLFISCDKKPKFSEEEKRQARLFIEVIQLDNESTNLSNSGEPYGIIDTSTINRMLELKSAALEKAKLIPNSVLLKMHKDLPENFDKYKQGISLRIQNLKYGYSASEIKGSKLIDEWTDWYDQNKKDIKVLKK